MIEKLKEIADTLDRILGDTDPHIEPGWTEEEIQREYPLFWSCRELYKMIKESKQMKLCETGHNVIVYTTIDCPLCKLMEHNNAVHDFIEQDIEMINKLKEYFDKIGENK